ncbi:hypothetical protein IVB69_03240 [Flavobacterium sp. J49]|uniref:hypothetical protein n=1 Tax=Flavobacterium sp. J49 TaxID=2718534 RepID=UPI001593A9D9|nr:hypothetical protein [Flavobacterium sp. J49]MBF6640484.1 hypothetical protein [Flavobacterium sp. J49]NIC01731.1 hypothetical protein [Flavobacterium sp. J49]
MKKVFLALLLFVSITTLAQEKKERKPEREKLTKEEKVDIQVKRMTKDLDLNEKQAKEVRAIVTKEVEKREAKKAEMDKKKEQVRAERLAEAKEHQAALTADMKKILTPDQFAKWEKNREEKKAKVKVRMSERRGKGKLDPIKEDK